MLKLRQILNQMFEDPRYPSLGPVVTFIRGTCIWPCRNRVQTFLYWITITFACYIIMNQIIFMIYMKNTDIFLNFLQFSCYHMGVLKILSFAIWQPKWAKIIGYISSNELEIQNDPRLSKELEKYKKKSRLFLTILWVLSVLTNVLFFSKTWRTVIRETESSAEVRTKVFYTWWPFDDRGRLGSYFDMLVQNLYGDVTTVYVMAWDALTENLMIVFAGQLRVVRLRCRYAFDTNDEKVQKKNLIKCHKHYISLIEMQQLCNSVVSPLLFIYLLTVAINFGVVISKLSTYDLAEKLAAIQFIYSLLVQLCLFYWLGNSVSTENELVSTSVYESQWLRCSPKLRRDVLLLARGTSRHVAFKAGPFNEVSLATFVSILRTSYSFYTLMETRQK